MVLMDELIVLIIGAELIVLIIGAERVDVIEAFAIEQFTTERDNGDTVR